MPKVLCKLLNASDFISGVKFVSHQDGMLSEEISDDAAASFLEVPGYELALPVKTAAELAADQRAADAEQKRLADEASAELARLADIQAKADAEQKRIADEAAAAELAKQTSSAPPEGAGAASTPPAGEVKEPTEADAAAAAAQKAADKKAAKQAAAAAAKA